MWIEVPRHGTVECDVEMDGYKVLDIVDNVGRSILYDYDLDDTEGLYVYQQAERAWVDAACDYGDYLADQAKEWGLDDCDPEEEE